MSTGRKGGHGHVYRCEMSGDELSFLNESDQEKLTDSQRCKRDQKAELENGTDQEEILILKYLNSVQPYFDELLGSS